MFKYNNASFPSRSPNQETNPLSSLTRVYFVMMDMKNRFIIPLNRINLAKVSLGQWQLFMLQEPDIQIDNKPFVSLTMMYHSQTHEYIWRVLGRLVESGRVNSFPEFLRKCHELFDSGTPCLGMKPLDAQFPLSCQFSKNCSVMIPKSDQSKICQACVESAENPVQFWQDIQDVAIDIIFDKGYKTLKTLKQRNEESWWCPMCPEHVPSTEMRNHLEKSHFFSQFYCFHCSDRFVDAKDLCFHTLQEHPEVNDVFCPVCPMSIQLSGDLESLSNHFRKCLTNKIQVLESEEHARKLNVCPHCCKPFTCELRLLSHMTICSREIPSSQKSIEEDPLEDPLKILDTSDEYDPTLETPTNLFFPSLEHSNQMADSPISETDLRNDESPPMTETDESLDEKNHVAPSPPIKSPDRTVKKNCFKTRKHNLANLTTDACPKCFKKVSPQAWSTHLMFNHGIGDFKSNACPMSFDTAKELTDHVTETHQDVKLLVCPNCDQSFSIQHLNDHMIACHTIIFMTNSKGQRVLFSGTVCTYCGGTFLNYNDLLRHKSQDCTNLEKLPEAKSVEVVKVSQESNLSSTLYQCGHCHKLYKTKGDLLTHLENGCDGKQMNANVKPASSKNITPCLLLNMDDFLKNSVDIGLEELDETTESASKDGDEDEISNKYEVPIKSPFPVESMNQQSNKIGCHICFKKLPAMIMPDHRMFCHQLGHFVCPNCPLIFETAKEVSKHIIAHPDVSKLECPNCKQEIDLGPDQKELEDHIGTCHKLKFRWVETAQKRVQYFGRICMACGHGFRTVEQLMEHEAKGSCSDEPYKSCLRVKYVESLEQQKKRIQATLSRDPKAWECKVCDRKFPNSNSLYKHRRTHKPAKPCLCDHCGKEFLHESAFRNHIRRVHPQLNKYICQDCGLKTDDSSRFKNHQKIHKPPEHLCTTCGKGFKNNFALVLHARTHSGEKPFK